MKKSLTLFLTLSLVLSACAGCSNPADYGTLEYYVSTNAQGDIYFQGHLGYIGTDANGVAIVTLTEIDGQVVTTAPGVPATYPVDAIVSQSVAIADGTTIAGGTAYDVIATDTNPVSGDYEFDLIPGHYVVGVDIPAGIYDVYALMGNGNISTSVPVEMGGVNQPLTANLGAYSSCRGLTLSQGTVLTVIGVVSRFGTTNHNKNFTSLRKSDVTETVDLEAGTYTAGVDFAPGTYDVVALSGAGVVSSSNITEGGLAAVYMGDNETIGNYFYSHEFKHCYLPYGAVITANDVNIQLKPSGLAINSQYTSETVTSADTTADLLELQLAVSEIADDGAAELATQLSVQVS
ncbi:MAG: hypothetical protein LBM93_02145 [Oscillospiraceae bacterium]|jgi:hypothetical protein|nr:hypothetical protein [Oscillospiraceae bacterium]